jgi:ABC-type sugar transport system permease subunit
MDPTQGRPTLRDDMVALPFLAPFLAVFVVFIGYPLFYSLWISVHRTTVFSDFYDLFGTMEFVGLKNYVEILSDPIFLWSVLLTFVYGILTIAPGIVLSLFLAMALTREGRIWASYRGGFFLPHVFDVYVVGIIWLMLYNPGGGLVSRVLAFLGFMGLSESGVLNNPWLTLPAIGFAMVLKNAGFGMILFLTSLKMIPTSIFEAAEVDGATRWQKLFFVTLPQLRPIILFLSITGMVGALNAFAEVYALTDGTGGTSVSVGGTTLQSARTSGLHLFTIFNQSMYGEAAAISFVLLVVAIGLAWLNFRVLAGSRN